MGLFGLFATAVGLGAMASDSIKDSISYDREYERAVKEGRDTFTVNGYKVFSTKTGNPCSKVRIGGIGGHIYLEDLKTGKLIENLSVKEMIKRTDESKEKSEKDGWKFYKSYIESGYCGRSNVWVNDDMPGKYFEHRDSWRPTIGEFRGRRYDYFKEAELKQHSFNGIRTMEPWPIYDGKEYYYDGTIKDDNEMARRDTQNAYEQAMNNGWKFFYDFYELVARDINTFEPYCYECYRYFVRAIVEEYEWGQNEDGTIIMKKFYKKDPNGIKYNVDGSKWTKRW